MKGRGLEMVFLASLLQPRRAKTADSDAHVANHLGLFSTSQTRRVLLRLKGRCLEMKSPGILIESSDTTYWCCEDAESISTRAHMAGPCALTVQG